MKTSTIVILAAVGVGVYLMFFKKTSMAEQETNRIIKNIEANEKIYGKNPSRRDLRGMVLQ